MIKIKDIVVSTQGGEDKKILKGISLDIVKGKNYCVLGKNGSGKSTLSSVIAGSPKYSVLEGTISIDSENLLDMSAEERSRSGVFLSFQNVPEIPGIKLSEYLRSIYNISIKSKKPDFRNISPFLFKRFIKKHLEELHIDEDFLNRDLNVGFSGGEKRKLEILQMKLLEPKYIILDEIDSGLDLDAFKKVCELLQSINSKDNSIIIITHYFKILDYIDVDEALVMKDGLIVEKGGLELIERIKENGFETKK